MVKFLMNVAGRYVALAAGLMFLWLLMSGFFHESTLLLFGVTSALLCAWLTLHMGILDEDSVPLGLLPGIFLYWLWLVIEIGKANFIVAWQVWSPKMSLSPRMIRVKAKQRSDTGIATFANSITLTPGTVSVEVLKDDILIHALTDGLADVAAIEDMGDKVCRVERGAKNPKKTGATSTHNHVDGGKT